MQVVRLLALHVVIGFVVAAVFMAALLLADPGGIGTLLQPAQAGLMPLGLLWLFTGLTFGVAQFATALGTSTREDGKGSPGSRSLASWVALRPVRVPAAARALRRPRNPSH